MAHMYVPVVVVAFVWLLLLYAVTPLFAEISCPNLSMEQGHTKIISCRSDEAVVDFYWYRGLTSKQSPILKLDNRGRGGTEYGGEHFQINLNGSMIITNAKVEHESYYTFVGYFNNGNFSTATFLVNITIAPIPPCLVISGCEPCKVCNLSISRNSGSLVCSISGSRPSVPLNWTITSHDGISYIKHQQTEETDKTTDTWSTSVLLAYEITKPCGVKEVLHCEAEDSLHILKSNAALVEISNGVCRGVGFEVWILIFAFLLLIIMVACCVAIRRHTNRGGKGVFAEENEVELQTLLQDKDEQVSELLSVLQGDYEKYCFLKPLPRGKDIPIATLYMECNCTVTDRKGKTTTVSNIISLITDYIRDERRVIFIGGLGYGKTTMTKWILHHWIQQKHPNFVLFYILLKDVKKEMKVSDIVLKSFPQGSRITIDTIEKVLRSTSCIVLLDGLDELSMYDRTKNPPPESEPCSSKTDSDNRLTIGELLNGHVQLAYKNLQVWVTSREIDYMKQQFPLPYITVKLNGFNPDQADEYIKRACKFYFACSNHIGNGVGKNNDLFENKEATRTADDGNIETDPGYKSSCQEHVVKQEVAGPEKEIFHWIKDFVHKNDIFCDFKDTPLLFILIVHVLVEEFTKSTRESLPKVPTLTALVSMIITCLESRYVQKKNYENLPSEVPNLESKLGQIAFDNSVHVGVRKRKFWDMEVGEENVDMALEIGLLKLSQKTSNAIGGQNLAFSSFTGIEFYHDFLQEYLAARYILVNLDLFSKLENVVKKRKDSSTIRILQFMSGAVDSQVLKICDILLNMGKWNNFIDCAYEARERKEFAEIIKKANAEKMNFTYLDKEYHRCALRTFCQQCYDLKIKLKKITFRSDCELEFLASVTLPQCDSLEFYEVTFTESLFVKLLQWLSKNSVTEVRFVKCTVPENISEELKPGLNDPHERDLKVYRTLWRKFLPSGTERLNLQTGRWTWLTTGGTNV